MNRTKFNCHFFDACNCVQVKKTVRALTPDFSLVIAATLSIAASGCKTQDEKQINTKKKQHEQTAIQAIECALPWTKGRFHFRNNAKRAVFIGSSFLMGTPFDTEETSPVTFLGLVKSSWKKAEISGAKKIDFIFLPSPGANANAIAVLAAAATDLSPDWVFIQPTNNERNALAISRPWNKCFNTSSQAAKTYRKLEGKNSLIAKYREWLFTNHPDITELEKPLNTVAKHYRGRFHLIIPPINEKWPSSIVSLPLSRHGFQSIWNTVKTGNIPTKNGTSEFSQRQIKSLKFYALGEYYDQRKEYKVARKYFHKALNTYPHMCSTTPDDSYWLESWRKRYKINALNLQNLITKKTQPPTFFDWFFDSCHLRYKGQYFVAEEILKTLCKNVNSDCKKELESLLESQPPIHEIEQREAWAWVQNTAFLANLGQYGALQLIRQEVKTPLFLTAMISTINNGIKPSHIEALPEYQQAPQNLRRSMISLRQEFPYGNPPPENSGGRRVSAIKNYLKREKVLWKKEQWSDLFPAAPPSPSETKNLSFSSVEDKKEVVKVFSRVYSGQWKFHSLNCVNNEIRISLYHKVTKNLFDVEISKNGKGFLTFRGYALRYVSPDDKNMDGVAKQAALEVMKSLSGSKFPFEYLKQKSFCN